MKFMTGAQFDHSIVGPELPGGHLRMNALRLLALPVEGGQI